MEAWVKTGEVLACVLARTRRMRLVSSARSKVVSARIAESSPSQGLETSKLEVDCSGALVRQGVDTAEECELIRGLQTSVRPTEQVSREQCQLDTVTTTTRLLTTLKEDVYSVTEMDPVRRHHRVMKVTRSIWSGVFPNLVGCL